MKKSPTNIIESIYFTTQQAVNFREIYEKNGKKIKIEIKSDAYKNQSYAKSSVFADNKWNEVYHIPSNLMKTDEGLIYTGTLKDKPEKAASDMAVDFANVVTKTEKILF